MLDSIVGICGNVIHLSGHPRRQRRRRSLRRGGGGGCWFDLTLHILRTSFNRRFQSTDPQDQHEVMSKRSSQYLIVGNQLGVVSPRQQLQTETKYSLLRTVYGTRTGKLSEQHAEYWNLQLQSIVCRPASPRVRPSLSWVPNEYFCSSNCREFSTRAANRSLCLKLMSNHLQRPWTIVSQYLSFTRRPFIQRSHSPAQLLS